MRHSVSAPPAALARQPNPTQTHAVVDCVACSCCCSQGLPHWLQVQDAWLWALGVHVFSWYMQIHPGHALLEGRKPALLDSLVQVRSTGRSLCCTVL